MPDALWDIANKWNKWDKWSKSKSLPIFGHLYSYDVLWYLLKFSIHSMWIVIESRKKIVSTNIDTKNGCYWLGKSLLLIIFRFRLLGLSWLSFFSILTFFIWWFFMFNLNGIIKLKKILILSPLILDYHVNICKKFSCKFFKYKQGNWVNFRSSMFCCSQRYCVVHEH